jgi:uncharacterized protein (DUF433 family)
MDWMDCPLIEQIPGKMSGAPVLRHTRMRPQDIISNEEMGAEWIAEAHDLPIEDVRAALAFYDRHRHELPPEYISAERRASAPAL